jgi:2-polyprenyl-6-methoxyphenol hydroxylase-like FAD-dependent oxidoreductase
VSIIVSKKAIIAGGSLGGLMTGIVLKAVGVDVHIYERSRRVLAPALSCRPRLKFSLLNTPV